MITMSLREEIGLLLFGLLIVAIYGLEFVHLVGYLAVRIRQGSCKGVRVGKSHLALHAVALIGILSLLYAWLIEPRWIDVNQVTLRTAKLKDAGFRIVQISDLHCDQGVLNEQRVARIVSGLKPDIVVATGDYLNDMTGLPRLRRMLSTLEAPLGKFAVTGNWDVRCWSDASIFEGTGFCRLERQTVLVAKGADTLAITGMGFGHSESANGFVEGLPEDRYDVLLFHTPDLVEDLANRGVDLYLCGHTHGGQVRLPWYGALVTFSKFGKKYESGMYRVGGTVLYVNRGLGLEPRPAPQVRFLARPEIAVFDILPAQE
ncbi:MAG TPA: metallophosphoesterase [Sedimentisphaerales bacterium]|jgi:predicted MPP superfamily phosphohydrolase|nr:metallophosphoesterase [Sedimentisphaerales bacterium]HNU28152.1 metallophosphoesterase [Sedimentisphaerales bacterium]